MVKQVDDGGNASSGSGVGGLIGKLKPTKKFYYALGAILLIIFVAYLAK